ncbi:MAG: MarR family transcriptional regulator [Rectinemataceae bacterium]
MSSPDLLLSNQVCFLFHRIDRAIVAQYRPLLAELGLTYPQYLAMLALWENEELSVGDLCGLLDLDTGTVSPLLKRLETAGLVTRRRGVRKDERIVIASLSPAGRALEEKARRIPGALASCLFQSDEEYRDLKTRLEALVGRIEEGGKSSAGGGKQDG